MGALGKNRVILVTGCSSGIGLALAKLLLPTEYRLVLTARKLENLQHEFSQSERIILRELDLEDLFQQQKVIDEVNERWGGVEVLINNAAIAYRAVIEDMDAVSMERQLKVNFHGPLNLIRLVLPKMREKRSGHIINLSSVSGMMAMPTMGGYSAAKFALEGASEALWYEARPWGVRVSLIAPGFIHSDSFKNVLWTYRSAEFKNNPYHVYYEEMGPFIAKLMNRAIATPEKIAKLIIKTMQTPDPPLRVPATIDAWGFGWLRRLLPRGVYHRFLYRSLPGIKHWV